MSICSNCQHSEHIGRWCAADVYDFGRLRCQCGAEAALGAETPAPAPLYRRVDQSIVPANGKDWPPILRDGRCNVAFLDKIVAALNGQARAETPTEMNLCEISQLILHKDQAYIFRQAEGCPECANYLEPKGAETPTPREPVGSQRDRNERLLSLARAVWNVMGLGRAEYRDIQQIFEVLDEHLPQAAGEPEQSK